MACERLEAGRRWVVGLTEGFVESGDELFKMERNFGSYFNWGLYS